MAPSRKGRRQLMVEGEGEKRLGHVETEVGDMAGLGTGFFHPLLPVEAGWLSQFPLRSSARPV